MDNNSQSDYREYDHQPPSFTPNENTTPTATAERPHQHPQEHHSFYPQTPPPPPTRVAPPPDSMPNPPAPQGVIPQPVVRVLSPRGVEYVFMTIALVTGAVGLASAFLAIVNGNYSFSVLYFPLSLLLVSVPVFSWLFLRLKQAELLDPAARLDASKRRSTQFIQISSFFVCFFTLIGFLTTIFAKLNGSYSGSMVKVILDVLVILLVAGGILFYYWRDEHKAS
jgi:hypothetical protein